jgi:hypothetical protein
MYLQAGWRTEQAIFACAADVAACAYLCGVPIVTRDDDIRAEARARGVRVVAMEERI